MAQPTVSPSAASYGSLGRPREGFQTGIVPNMRGSLLGTVEMSLNETRMFTIPLGGATWYWGRSTDGKRIVSATDCYASAYYVEGGILKDLGSVGDGINVKAVGEGIGRVYGSKSGCKCEYEGGEQGRCPIYAVWLVVVGEKGYMEYTGKKRSTPSDTGQAPDIKRASVSGRTVMRGSKTPVSNAQISLVSSQGGPYGRDDWKSGSNGEFNIKADNMLISGVYEVMAYKKSADMGTREDPITVDRDLWPIKRYLVSITKESTQQGVLRVGDIEMDTVDNIFNKGSGREATENRDPVKKDTTPKQAGKDTTLPPGGYNPLGDPNLKSPGTSPKSSDITSADKLGGEFQEGQGKPNKSEQGQQAPISQPETYTGTGEKEDDSTKKAPYPPGYPPYGHPPDDVVGEGGFYPGGPNWGKGGKHGGDASKSGTNSGSSSGSSSGSGSVQSVTAELHNKAGENVHIFVEGQDNFGPHNRLAPGGSRTIKPNVSQGGTLKFVAGRNGQILSHCNWTFNPKSSGSVALVTFSGSNSLKCSTK